MKKNLSLLILLSLTSSFLVTAQLEEIEEPTPTIQTPPTPAEPVNFEKEFFEAMRTFGQVGQIASQRHYNVQHVQEGLKEAINTFLNTLDPHSNYLEEKTYKAMMEATSGQFYGVGIVIDNTRKQKDKYLTIVDTIPGGPADKAGIRPHDKIMEIDGKRLEGMATEEATSRLKGERNSVVHIKVLRDKQKDLLSFDVKRDVIKEQSSLSFHLPEYDIHYLSLTTFTTNAIKQIAQLLQQATKKQYKALILDLRNNSGGLLNAAIDIAGLFLPQESLVVTTKDRNNTIIESYKTTQKPVANSALPIFILINNYTASAAEILAGALKIHSENAAAKAGEASVQSLMVFLVGTKTFGKGSVQEVIPIGNNSAIKITTSLYYLPNDTTIQGSGIEPDFLIDNCFPPTEQMQWFTKYYGREQTLTHYIKPNNGQKEMPATELSEKKKKLKLWADRAKEMLQKDNQLRETISLANQLHTFKTSCPKNVYNRPAAITFLKANHLTDERITIEEVKM